MASYSPKHPRQESPEAASTAAEPSPACLCRPQYLNLNQLSQLHTPGSFTYCKLVSMSRNSRTVRHHLFAPLKPSKLTPNSQTVARGISGLYND